MPRVPPVMNAFFPSSKRLTQLSFLLICAYCGWGEPILRGGYFSQNCFFRLWNQCRDLFNNMPCGVRNCQSDGRRAQPRVMQLVFEHASNNRYDVAGTSEHNPRATLRNQVRRACFLSHRLRNHVANDRDAARVGLESRSDAELRDHHIRCAHEFLDLVGKANDFDRKRRIESDRFSRSAQVLVLARQEDRLHVQLAASQLTKDLRNVAATNPTCIYKDCELLGIQS